MSDDVRSEHKFMIECPACGGKYPPNDEVAEDHEADCPIRSALVKRGQVRDTDTDTEAKQ